MEYQRVDEESGRITNNVGGVSSTKPVVSAAASSSASSASGILHHHDDEHLGGDVLVVARSTYILSRCSNRIYNFRDKTKKPPPLDLMTQETWSHLSKEISGLFGAGRCLSAMWPDTVIFALAFPYLLALIYVFYTIDQMEGLFRTRIWMVVAFGAAISNAFCLYYSRKRYLASREEEMINKCIELAPKVESDGYYLHYLVTKGQPARSFVIRFRPIISPPHTTAPPKPIRESETNWVVGEVFGLQFFVLVCMYCSRFLYN